MNRLLDNLRHMGNSWAIESGRYAGADPNAEAGEGLDA